MARTPPPPENGQRALPTPPVDLFDMLDIPAELEIDDEAKIDILRAELKGWRNTRWLHFFRVRSRTASKVASELIAQEQASFEQADSMVAIIEAELKRLGAIV